MQFRFSDDYCSAIRVVQLSEPIGNKSVFSLKQIKVLLKLRQFCGLVFPVLSESSIGCTTSQTPFCLHGIDEFEWNLIWRVYNFTEKKFAISIIINTQGRVHNVILGNRMQYMKTTISTTNVLSS